MIRDIEQEESKQRPNSSFPKTHLVFVAGVRGRVTAQREESPLDVSVSNGGSRKKSSMSSLLQGRQKTDLSYVSGIG